MKLRIVFALIVLIVGISLAEEGQKFCGELKGESVKKVMSKVADWHIKNPGKHWERDWTYGALYAGMSAWAQMADSDKYVNWLLKKGDKNQWNLGNRMYHADDHAVGQMYAELYEVYKRPEMIRPLQQQFDRILEKPSSAKLKWNSPGAGNRWCWCDALFMAPPSWARLAAITGEKKYLDFMDKEWWYTTDYLYDKEEHFYYRDSKYFDKREANGQKVFWGRGNGWVFGGLVRVLDYMPLDYPTRGKYVQLYKEMADKLAEIQSEDGLWRASLLDAGSYPNPETSSSSFFCFGLAWGLNHGYLDRDKFLPVVEKAWAGLVKAVHPDGKLGWVQPIGENPRNVTYDMTEIYGIGAFLLAGSEVYRISMVGDKGLSVEVINPISIFRDGQTVEICLKEIADKKSCLGEDLKVFSYDGNKFLATQLFDRDNDGDNDSILFSADFSPNGRKIYRLVKACDKYPAVKVTDKTYCKFVPERKDDFAWENDRIAFRMYGPALQKAGEISSGIDVWAKKVTKSVIDQWYAKGDYHNDHGEGVDFYKVGTSRGCGGLGVLNQGKLYTSGNFSSYKILANGPVRSVFELSYDSWDCGEYKVSEIKRISIDMGNNLSRFENKFEIQGGSGMVPIAIGVVKRGNSGEMIYNVDEGWMGYWQPADKAHGVIGCGVVVEPGRFVKEFIDFQGQGLLVTDVKENSNLVYYSGACWDRSGQFKNRADWNNYLKEFLFRLSNPVDIKVGSLN